MRRWRAEYRAGDIADGTGWVLLIKAPGVEIETLGVNAYPDRGGREHEGEAPAEFQAFLDAMGALIADSEQGWPPRSRVRPPSPTNAR